MESYQLLIFDIRYYHQLYFQDGVKFYHMVGHSSVSNVRNSVICMYISLQYM